MRIAVIQETFPPYISGSGKRVYEIFKRLSARGHQVTVYTAAWDENIGAADTLEGIVVKRIKVDNFITKDNFRVPHRSLHYIMEAVRRIRRDGLFDILELSSSPLVHVYLAKIYQKQLARKINLTVHECWLDYWFRYKPLHIAIPGFTLEYFSYFLPDNLVAVSNFTKKRLVSYIPGLNKKLSVIPNGVDKALLKYPRPQSTGPNLIFIGRLYPHKRVEDILYIYKGIVEEVPDATLYIVGGGPELPRLKHIAKEYGLKNAVFTGPLPTREVIKLLASSKVLLIASVREGFSIVTLESLALGTPVVARYSPYSAVTDLIVPGYNGFIAFSLDKAKYYVGLLLRDADLWKKLSYNARRFAENFSWDNIALKQEEVYRSLLE